MLGITSIASGRMGNRLFHYHILRQLAQKTESQYFHIKLPEAQSFQGLTKTHLFLPKSKQTYELTSKELISTPVDQILSLIQENTRKGVHTILTPPILGEVFFDYLFFNPNEFLKIKPQYTKNTSLSVEQDLNIALHFRGTDFLTWNINAALPFSYYEKAIHACLEEFPNRKPAFYIFTDDQQYAPYVETVSLLQQKLTLPVFTGNPDKSPIYDFYTMSQCDMLISSPSTFAIFAGILGKTKKIIHSDQWLDYSCNRNDLFWVRLAETQNPYYQLWKRI